MHTRNFSAPVTECAAMQRTRSVLYRLAQTNIPLLLQGETGTGRGTLAMAASELRRESGRKIIQVSVLDGVPPSARTVLRQSVLFIRDIDLLNQEDQRWIAQAITEQVQLVATTKPEAILEPMLARHVSTGTVPLLPLRQRRDDTMAWFRYFVDTLAVSRHVNPPTLSAPAEAVIRGYLWPGNLHELKQRAERACALVDDTVIRPEHLGLYSNTEPTVTPLEEATASFKRKYVQQVLDQCGGNRTLAARLLCVDPRTIFRFLKNQRKG